MRVLHKFFHGIGDAVAFTAVLKHLKRAYPDWVNTVHTSIGKHSAFTGLANHVQYVTEPDHSQFDRVISYDWPECGVAWDDSPSTKAALCLRQVFQIRPDWDLLSYTIQVGPEAQADADEYLATLPASRGVVFLHYQGNTSSSRKSLDHGTAHKICDYLIREGYTPVILDWDRRSPLPDNKAIFCPDVTNGLWQSTGTGDAEVIGALLKRAALFIGVDSGPQKCAWAVGCPSLNIWTAHHPVHYCDRADGALHIVPAGHGALIRGNRAAGEKFFQERYQSVTYDTRTLTDTIRNEVARLLKLNPMTNPEGLKAVGYTEDYYLEHFKAGLDYLNYGEWQRDYGEWIVNALSLKAKTVLDVGCACGSIAAGMAEAGAFVSGVDLSAEMIARGRARWEGFPLFVCDSVNLHRWPDCSFDFLHSNQVFEHFRPDLVPFILRELLRVSKPNGLLFCVLDTVEQFARQNRRSENGREVGGDATHICIQPLNWWLEQATAAGWRVDPPVLDLLKAAPGSFFRRYDWDSFTLRKP
jgi:SAM-dependent methyltransferase